MLKDSAGFELDLNTMNAQSVLDVNSLAANLVAEEAVLVCVSGGADSMCMLHGVCELAPGLRIALHVVHVNHLTRGDQSKRDADFVRETASRLEIPFHYTEARPLSQKPRGQTAEEFMREERHARIFETAAEIGVRTILFGHTSDDLAESMLMNLLRGSGLHGLAFSFCQERAGFKLLRPLWETPREQVIKYLSANGIKFREDVTNQLLEFTRNRVRHQLIPQIEREFNPGVRSALNRTARVLSLAHQFIESSALKHLSEIIDKTGEESVLSFKQIGALPPILRMEVVRLWLERNAPTDASLSFSKITQILELCDRPGEAEIHLSEKLRVVKSYDNLILMPPGAAMPLPPAWDQLPLAEIERPVLVTQSELARQYRTFIPLLDGRTLQLECSWIHYPDDEAAAPPVAFPLLIRNRLPGDRLSPSVRLKTVLINDKVPRFVRDHLILVSDANGEILSVIGSERINARIRKKRVVPIRVESWIT